MSQLILFRYLAHFGWAQSFGEARRLVRAGRVMVNGKHTTDEGMPISLSDQVIVSPNHNDQEENR